MAVVTVARQLGSLGDEIGRAVAGRLGLRLVDQDLINEVATQLGVTPDAISGRDEREPGLVSDLVRTMRRLYPATVAAEGGDADVDESAYLQVMRQVAWEIARTGDAVIVGRGATFLLERSPAVLHVLVIAPSPIRAERVMESSDITTAEAARRIRESDTQRARYVRRFYGHNWLDPAHYDLVLNTGHFSEQAAVDLVVRAIQSDAPTNSSRPAKDGKPAGDAAVDATSSSG